MKDRIFISALLLVAVVFGGCKSRMGPEIKTSYDRPLPPGMYALRKITNPHEIPDFTTASLDLTDLRVSVSNSLNYLLKPSSRNFFPCGRITHRQTVDSLKEFAGLLDSGLTGVQLNDAIRRKFDARYPLYKTPKDLVKGRDGQILGQRRPDGLIRQYPARSVIEDSGMLKGNELVWLSDPFEAYIAHVQGSAKLRLSDGKLVTIGYNANNGHEYHSVARELIKDGRISGDKINLSAMIDYFKMHPEQVDMYVSRNPRFVFFRKEEGPPLGSLNEPVTALRSIATDKSIFPRGALTFISTTLPQARGGVVVNRFYSGFALDQDTGGAIRAPGRCDVYMGEGEIAGKMAGQTYQEGRLYYLFLKSNYD